MGAGEGTVGAELYFFYDTRDSSWGAAATITYESDDISLKLRAGGSTKCTKKGAFLGGAEE